MSAARFIIWDVQHGSACYVQTPNNRHFVIDLGVGDISDNNQTFSPLRHLKANGINQIDAVIITHPHRDHLDDIFNFDSLRPTSLWRPVHLTESEIRAANQKDDTGILDKYFEIHNRYSSPITTEANPFLESNNGGVTIQSFQPTNSARSNLNNHSKVLLFTFENIKILIPGDNEAPSWRELLESETFRKAITNVDVLVAAHHGRQAGYCADIFEHFKPKLTIISDGPFSDTSATDAYCQQSTGWLVHRPGGKGAEIRKCLTTRADGTITINIGRNNTERFLEVITEL